MQQRRRYSRGRQSNGGEMRNEAKIEMWMEKEANAEMWKRSKQRWKNVHKVKHEARKELRKCRRT